MRFREHINDLKTRVWHCSDSRVSWVGTVIRRRTVWSVSGDRFPAWTEMHLHTACSPAVGFIRPRNATGTGEKSGRRLKLMTARADIGGTNTHSCLSIIPNVCMTWWSSTGCHVMGCRNDPRREVRHRWNKFLSVVSVLLGQCAAVSTAQVACSTVITVYVIKRLHFVSVVCLCASCLTLNSNYFPSHINQLMSIMEMVECFLWGSNWIFR